MPAAAAAPASSSARAFPGSSPSAWPASRARTDSSRPTRSPPSAPSTSIRRGGAAAAIPSGVRRRQAHRDGRGGDLRRPAKEGVTLALRIADMPRAARSGIMAPMLKAAVVLIALLPLGLGACEREQKGISQDLPAARATKARADAQAIAGAVRPHPATFGALPEAIEGLTDRKSG